MSKVLTIARVLAGSVEPNDEHLRLAQAVEDALDGGPEDQLLDAIAHGRDEDVEGRMVIMPRATAMVAVSHIDRTRDERNAIADMLRAATTKEAIETAHARLGRHLADHP